MPTGQERQIRDFPERAVDEVVLNAFAHRDWTLGRPIVIDQSPVILSVDSPGGLPIGVRRDPAISRPPTSESELCELLRGFIKGLVPWNTFYRSRRGAFAPLRKRSRGVPGNTFPGRGIGGRAPIKLFFVNNSCAYCE